MTARKNHVWQLRLYVAGQSPKSLAALANLRRVCDEQLGGRYRIEVVDLLDRPGLARRDDIIVLPTLVRRLPPPMRKIIGDLSNEGRLLLGLDLHPLNRDTVTTSTTTRGRSR